MAVDLIDGVADNVTVTPKIAGTLRNISVTFGSSTTTNASGNFTVVPGTVQRLQVLLPGETSDPGSASGKTGTPVHQVVGVAFNVVVNAVDAYWNRVTSVNDNIDLQSTDLAATLPLGACARERHRTRSTPRSTPPALGRSPPPTRAMPSVMHGASAPVIAIVDRASRHRGARRDRGTRASSTGKTGSPTARTAGTPFNVDVYAMDSTWNIDRYVDRHHPHHDDVPRTARCPPMPTWSRGTGSSASP